VLQRAALLIAVVLSLVACAGAAAPAVPTTSASGPAVDRADALVADLIARRYEAVVGRFDDAMHVAVPVERNR
jgi:hypothetical protein